jgi:uncharacterized protein YhdP
MKVKMMMKEKMNTNGLSHPLPRLLRLPLLLKLLLEFDDADDEDMDFDSCSCEYAVAAAVARADATMHQMMHIMSPEPVMTMKARGR